MAGGSIQMKTIETVLFRRPAEMTGSTVLFINSGV